MNFESFQVKLPPKLMRALFPKSLPWKIAHAASPLQEILLTPFKVVSAYVQGYYDIFKEFGMTKRR